MATRRRRWWALAGALAILSVFVTTALAADVAAAKAELDALKEKVAAFQVIDLPKGKGMVKLTPEQSLTIEQLRGVVLDANPPVLGKAPKYDKRMSDTYKPGEAPYEARDIAPFRFKYFNCEFSYGGWHNFKMTDYASTRGFNILYPYTRKAHEKKHLPENTKWLRWGGFIHWSKWFKKHKLPEYRYDMLVPMDLVALHTKAGIFKNGGQDYLMIDMEHPVLSPKRLRAQAWYPKNGGKAFEKKYYDGYAKTYTSAALAARKQGWKNISIYGWAPYGRTWGGLEKAVIDPGENFAWNAFGRQICETVDIINNSVYCFYWSSKNVAYTLANIDNNMKLLNSMGKKRSVRPYYWTLLHGGGGGWRWWRSQPVATEEKRAMIAMGFFTGFDGLVTWNWSGTGTHHEVPKTRVVKKGGKRKSANFFSTGPDIMLKDDFEYSAQGAKAPTKFKRYDVVQVTAYDAKQSLITFQKIQTRLRDKGVGAKYPVYVMPEEQLRSHLRIQSEPVAAMIEGMALVKPFEYILRHGEVKIDVPAKTQFGKGLPLVRRVKLGPYHVVITYDPAVIYGKKPRAITLTGFDGSRGRTLRLPADEQTRVFVLRDSM